MVAHLPRFPLLLLFVYLGVHVPAAHGDPAQPQTTTYDANNCSNSMCGSVDIHYPFYMSRKRADYSGYYPCGYTGLEISCEDRGPTGTPVIQLGGHNYIVQNIFYERSAIILVDSDVLVLDKCPRVSHGVISFGEVGLRYNNSSDEALTFFFDCKAGLPDGYDMYRINCNSAKSPFGDGASFVLAPDDHGKAQEQELAADCKNLSVPVRSEVLLKVMASNSASLRSGGYGDVLKQGFELLWLQPAEECHPCEQSGGKCSYGQDGRFLVCLCSDGTAGSLNCTGHGASTAPRSGKSIRTDPPSICLASCLFNRHTTHLHISGCVSNFRLVASLLLRVPGLRCARVLQFSEDRTVPAFSVWNEDQRIRTPQDLVCVVEYSSGE